MSASLVGYRHGAIWRAPPCAASARLRLEYPDDNRTFEAGMAPPQRPSIYLSKAPREASCETAPGFAPRRSSAAVERVKRRDDRGGAPRPAPREPLQELANGGISHRLRTFAPRRACGSALLSQPLDVPKEQRTIEICKRADAARLGDEPRKSTQVIPLKSNRQGWA